MLKWQVFLACLCAVQGIRGQRFISYYYEDDANKTVPEGIELPVVSDVHPDSEKGTAPTNEDGTLITLDVGMNVQGYKMRVVNGREVNAFEGIPFAESPLGPLRFRAPVKKGRWEGTWQATRLSKPCMYVERPEGHLHPSIKGGEDCLFLNVYSPPQPKNLPVVVFIHGGSFQSGSGNTYGPSYFLQHDIVLVTMNYRVGLLGFLSTGTEACGGNWGLKDQALAIEWVTKHIGRFGGNAERLTLIGHSAGAASTHLQILSPKTRDKIKAAVALSGSAFNSWALTQPSRFSELLQPIATATLCPNDNDKAFVECLRTRSAANITAASTLASLRHVRFFSPVVEGNWEGAFITKTPKEYYDAGEVPKIPFITTITSLEADVPLAGTAAEAVNRALRIPLIGDRIMTDLWPTLLFYDSVNVDNVDATTEAIIKFYGGKEKISRNPGLHLQMASDRHFALGTRKSVRYHSKIAPTYSYYFSFDENRTRTDNGREISSKLGAAHGDDLLYIFNRTSVFRATSDNYAVADFLQTVLISFATVGEPLYTWDGNWYRMWAPTPSDAPVNFLHLDKGLRMTDIPDFQKATDFWESLNIREP